MIIALLGASGSGKDLIRFSLFKTYKYKTIVKYTTREQRDGEINGKDYHFIPLDMFEEASERGLFAEEEDWQKGRLYGTLKSDYVGKEDKVVILTPSSLRQLRKNCPDIDLFTVFIDASLGTRMKRYIERVGLKEFTFKDKDELCARVERDYAAYLGIEKEVDLVVNNDHGVETTNLIREIHTKCQENK